MNQLAHPLRTSFVLVLPPLATHELLICNFVVIAIPGHDKAKAHEAAAGKLKLGFPPPIPLHVIYEDYCSPLPARNPHQP